MGNIKSIIGRIKESSIKIGQYILKSVVTFDYKCKQNILCVHCFKFSKKILQLYLKQ